MNAEGRRDTEQRECGCGVAQLPAERECETRAELDQDHWRQQEARNVVRGHLVEHGLRCGDLRDARQDEEERKYRTSGDDKNPGRYHRDLRVVLYGLLGGL